MKQTLFNYYHYIYKLTRVNSWKLLLPSFLNFIILKYAIRSANVRHLQFSNIHHQYID